jgi:hypothetical protein
MSVEFDGWKWLPDTQHMVSEFIMARDTLIQECENLAGKDDSDLLIRRKLAQASVYRKLIDKYKTKKRVGE